MTEEVEKKLKSVYDELLSTVTDIYNIFVDQFGEENVSLNNVRTFDELVQYLNAHTLGAFISQYSVPGVYTIDRADYEAHGRGKPFLEYVPDLGIIDHIKPQLRSAIKTTITVPISIVVHFPKVRVTNEHDKYIDIEDLWAKVELTLDGHLVDKFTLARTTYSVNQFLDGYAHSHLPRKYNREFGDWSYPCLGTGPIENTILTLNDHPTLDIWGLFAYELSIYVTVESLAGVPYIRLESVGSSSSFDCFSDLYEAGRSLKQREIRVLDEFIKYYAKKNKFKITWVNGHYELGEDIVTALIKLSNEFIKFHNSTFFKHGTFNSLDELKARGILKEYIINNGKIYSTSHCNSLERASAINGMDSDVHFKGKTIKLKVEFDTIENMNTSLILCDKWCSYIITRILTIINYNYAKKEGDKSGEKRIFI